MNVIWWGDLWNQLSSNKDKTIGSEPFTLDMANTYYWVNLIAAIFIGVVFLIAIIWMIYTWSSKPKVIKKEVIVPTTEKVITTTEKVITPSTTQTTVSTVSQPIVQQQPILVQQQPMLVPQQPMLSQPTVAIVPTVSRPVMQQPILIPQQGLQPVYDTSMRYYQPSNAQLTPSRQPTIVNF